MTQQAERRRDRTSFQELAKMAQTPPPPSVTDASFKSGPLSQPSQPGPGNVPLSWPSAPSGPWSGADSDSGMVDLKSMAQSDPNAGARAQSTALANEGLFDDAPRASAAAAAPVSSAPSAAPVAPISSAPAASVSAAPSLGPVPTSAAVPAVSVVSAVPMPAPREEEKKKGGALVALGVVATLGALAAGAFFYVKQARQAEVAAAPKPAAPAVVAAPAPAPTQAAPEPVAAKEPEPAAPPPAEVDAPKNGKHVAMAKKAGPSKPSATDELKEMKADKAGATTGLSGSLADEMRKRVGPEEKKDEAMKPAEDMAGRQPKPSQGQVQGAINPVLMKARECLGPDDPVSKANVVFGSNGSVQSVSVSGAAAGKPAEACIKGALGKAKVPAFSDATYSFPVTVRPL